MSSIEHNSRNGRSTRALPRVLLGHSICDNGKGDTVPHLPGSGVSVNYRLDPKPGSVGTRSHRRGSQNKETKSFCLFVPLLTVESSTNMFRISFFFY